MNSLKEKILNLKGIPQNSGVHGVTRVIEHDILPIKGDVSHRLPRAFGNGSPISLTSEDSPNSPNYFLAIGNFHLSLTSCFTISPNFPRFLQICEECCGQDKSQIISLMSSDGKSIEIKFEILKSFRAWHHSLREAIVALKFNDAFSCERGNLSVTKILETIEICEALVPSANCHLLRAKQVHKIKVLAQEMLTSLTKNAHSICREDIRALFNEIQSDPLLLNDTQVQLLKKIEPRLFTKHELDALNAQQVQEPDRFEEFPETPAICSGINVLIPPTDKSRSSQIIPEHNSQNPMSRKHMDFNRASSNASAKIRELAASASAPSSTSGPTSSFANAEQIELSRTFQHTNKRRPGGGPGSVGVRGLSTAGDASSNLAARALTSAESIAASDLPMKSRSRLLAKIDTPPSGGSRMKALGSHGKGRKTPSSSGSKNVPEGVNNDFTDVSTTALALHREMCLSSDAELENITPQNGVLNIDAKMATIVDKETLVKSSDVGETETFVPSTPTATSVSTNTRQDPSSGEYSSSSTNSSKSKSKSKARRKKRQASSSSTTVMDSSVGPTDSSIENADDAAAAARQAMRGKHAAALEDRRKRAEERRKSSTTSSQAATTAEPKSPEQLGQEIQESVARYIASVTLSPDSTSDHRRNSNASQAPSGGDFGDLNLTPLTNRSSGSSGSCHTSDLSSCSVASLHSSAFGSRSVSPMGPGGRGENAISPKGSKRHTSSERDSVRRALADDILEPHANQTHHEAGTQIQSEYTEGPEGPALDDVATPWPAPSRHIDGHVESGVECSTADEGSDSLQKRIPSPRWIVFLTSMILLAVVSVSALVIFRANSWSGDASLMAPWSKSATGGADVNSSYLAIDGAMGIAHLRRDDRVQIRFVDDDEKMTVESITALVDDAANDIPTMTLMPRPLTIVVDDSPEADSRSPTEAINIFASAPTMNVDEIDLKNVGDTALKDLTMSNSDPGVSASASMSPETPLVESSALINPETTVESAAMKPEHVSEANVAHTVKGVPKRGIHTPLVQTPQSLELSIAQKSKALFAKNQLVGQAASAVAFDAFSRIENANALDSSTALQRVVGRKESSTQEAKKLPFGSIRKFFSRYLQPVGRVPLGGLTFRAILTASLSGAFGLIVRLLL